MWAGSGKVVPYRAEAIIAFPSDWAGERLLGRELLRGAVQAPRVWRPRGNWQRWYRVLFEQILPVHVLRCSGLVFINFFSDQILDPMIQGLVRSCPFRDRVVLEWVERPAGARRLARAGGIFQGLREEGFSLAIDDVGAGADGLGRWALVQADFVKASGHLLHRARADVGARAVLRSLGHAIRDEGHARYIVEWVELWDDWWLAQECGADAWQGFLSRKRPVSAGGCE